MKPLDAAVLTVLAVAVVLAVAWHGRRGRGGFCPGPRCPPYNLGLYDAPHEGYPVWQGRAALGWDSDGRCAASCAQLPCTIWCR